MGDANLWEFGSKGRLERVKVQGRMRCNTVGGNIAGCIAGQGFGRFLHYQVLDAIARGELVRILPGLEPAPRPLSLVYPSKQHGTARVSTLVEHLSEHLRARLGEFALPTEKH